MSTPISPFQSYTCMSPSARKPFCSEKGTAAPLHAFFLSCQSDKKRMKNYTALEIMKSTWLVCYALMPFLARRPATTSPFPPPIQPSFAIRRVTLTTFGGVPSIIAAEKLTRFDIACSTKGETCQAIDFPTLKSTIRLAAMIHKSSHISLQSWVDKPSSPEEKCVRLVLTGV